MLKAQKAALEKGERREGVRGGISIRPAHAGSLEGPDGKQTCKASDGRGA